MYEKYRDATSTDTGGGGTMSTLKCDVSILIMHIFSGFQISKCRPPLCIMYYSCPYTTCMLQQYHTIQSGKTILNWAAILLDPNNFKLTDVIKVSYLMLRIQIKYMNFFGISINYRA